MSDFDHDHGGHHDKKDRFSRRKVLQCITWAGTGVLWTIAGGVPRSLGIIGEAAAQEASGLTFLQISDSHVGFDRPAKPNALGTLEEAINKVKALPVKPAFMIHTGDITHLPKPQEFDNAARIISQARLDTHYVPGEHDLLDDEKKLYRERYGSGTKGDGRLDVAPPVVDLTAQGFSLVRGRLDYIDGRAIAAIVYRRHAHVINLFVGQVSDTAHRAAKIETVQGFNIRHWRDQGLDLWAISDLNIDELQEFGAKFESALHTTTGT